MNALQFIKHRRKQKCQFKKQKADAALYRKLGQVLSKEGSVRSQMEVKRPSGVLPPPQELDFIF
jgi:hypothetical protein